MKKEELRMRYRSEYQKLIIERFAENIHIRQMTMFQEGIMMFI